MNRSLGIATAAAASLALAVAGCGSSSKSSSSSSSSSTPAPPAAPSTSSGGAGGSLTVTADKSGALKFDQSSLSAKAGKVTITMDNPASLPHGIAVEGNGVDKTGQVVSTGGKSTVTATLKPGKYTFYCPVPGHKQAGMQGTLTVQ